MISATTTDGIAHSLAERAWQVIRADQISELAEIFAADAEMRIAAMTGQGIDYVMGVMGRHQKSYPDIKHEVLSVIESADGTSACRELRFSGTQSGPLRNPQTGEIIPPTGKTINWHAAEVVRVTAGKITTWHAYFDRMEIDQQIRGVKP
ncbi:MAG: ester cyclase [Actinomycetota bacterium]|nr:ester cyclase [Actinomycetota bacterium]